MSYEDAYEIDNYAFVTQLREIHDMVVSFKLAKESDESLFIDTFIEEKEEEIEDWTVEKVEEFYSALQIMSSFSNRMRISIDEMLGKVYLAKMLDELDEEEE
jgi:hypothetical protein